MIIFLTGGTGLIGSHVAERLRHRGDRVVALVRPSSDTGHLRSIGCDLVVGDVTDVPGELAEAMRGADVVVHAAALVYRAGSRSDYLRVNVGGTERMLEAAAVAAPRFVHLSSVAVYAGLPMDAPLTEDRWTDADPRRQNGYAASKHLAERAAWSAHEAGGVRVTTIRPSVVYGERDRAATQAFVRYASLPVLPLVGGGRTTIPVVYAGNVARAVVAAIDREPAAGRAYNVALDLPLTARELASAVGDAIGRRPRIVAVPAGPAVKAASLLEMTARAIPFVEPPDLARAARSLARPNPYDSTRARLELGWSGLVPHEVGIRRTMEWWARER